MYLLAIICPPLAVLLAGRPFQAFINIFLLALGGVPGVIHAILVVKEHKEEKRFERLVRLQSHRPTDRS